MKWLSLCTLNYQIMKVDENITVGWMWDLMNNH